MNYIKDIKDLFLFSRKNISQDFFCDFSFTYEEEGERKKTRVYAAFVDNEKKEIRLLTKENNIIKVPFELNI